MKKLILHSFFFAACMLVITSCSKQVKVPASKVNTSSATSKTVTTPAGTTTQTETQSGHTCPGSSSSNGSGGMH